MDYHDDDLEPDDDDHGKGKDDDQGEGKGEGGDGKTKKRKRDDEFEVSRSSQGGSTLRPLIRTVGFEFEVAGWTVMSYPEVGSKHILIAFGQIERAELLKLEPDSGHGEVISEVLESEEQIGLSIDGFDPLIKVIGNNQDQEFPTPAPWKDGDDEDAEQYWYIENATAGALGSVQITVAIPLELFPMVLTCQDPQVEADDFFLSEVVAYTKDFEAGSVIKGFCSIVAYYLTALVDVSISDQDGPKHQLSLLARFDFCTMYKMLGEDDQRLFEKWIGLKGTWATLADPTTLIELDALFTDSPVWDLAPMCRNGYHTGGFQIPSLICPSRRLWFYSILKPELAFTIFKAKINSIFDDLAHRRIRFPIGWCFMIGNQWSAFDQEFVVDLAHDGNWVPKKETAKAFGGGPAWQVLRIAWKRLDILWRTVTEGAFTFLDDHHVDGKDLMSPPPWYEHDDKLPYAMGCYPKAEKEYRLDNSKEGLFLFEIRSIGMGTGGLKMGLSFPAVRKPLLALFRLINKDTELPPLKKKKREGGRITFDNSNHPIAVNYEDEAFVVEPVSDDGNCFFYCCAAFVWGDASRYMEMRQKLGASVHLKSGHDRVVRDCEYATDKDIEAMANELGIVIVLHECPYGGKPIQRRLGSGDGQELHLLFQFLDDGSQIEGMGHTQPMKKRR